MSSSDTFAANPFLFHLLQLIERTQQQQVAFYWQQFIPMFAKDNALERAPVGCYLDCPNPSKFAYIPPYVIVDRQELEHMRTSNQGMHTFFSSLVPRPLPQDDGVI